MTVRPTRRGALTMVAVAVTLAPAMATMAATAPDPAVAAWIVLEGKLRLVRSTDVVLQDVMRRRPPEPGPDISDAEHRAWRDACYRSDDEAGFDAAFDRWSAAVDAAMAQASVLRDIRPTTEAGRLAKLTAARWLMSLKEDIEDEGEKMLASLEL